jgi:cell wall-associated NlpC family hydrolase
VTDEAVSDTAVPDPGVSGTAVSEDHLSDDALTFDKARDASLVLVDVQLELHRVLAKRSRSVNAASHSAAVSHRASLEQRRGLLDQAGLTSPRALREAAGVLLTHRQPPGPTLVTLTQARRVAAALYPEVPAGLSTADVAAVLMAAATEHDRRALAEAAAAETAADVRYELLSPLKPGEMAKLSFRTRPVVSLASLFHRHAVALASQEAALQVAAVAALRHAKVSDPVAARELAGVWNMAGYRRSNAVLTALSNVGKAYRFAGRGPDAFDCSGLTAVAWAHSGLHLKTSSFSQRAQVIKVNRPTSVSGNLSHAFPNIFANTLSSSRARPAQRPMSSNAASAQPGDLVFYKVRSNSSGDPSGHVAMLIGSGTLIVEAQQNAYLVHVAPVVEGLVDMFGQVRLAGERTELSLSN